MRKPKLFFLAMIAAKCTRFFLKILGRKASCTPGKVAIKICPDFMNGFIMPRTVICVTGTNGKTTTSNMITSVLRNNGYSVTNNSYGSNIQAGVCSALLEDSDFSGRIKKDAAVLEVDERSSILVYNYIKPDIIVCTNIMRDSLKRNANTDFISFILNSSIPSTSKLIINADDFICSRLCPDNSNRIYYGIDAEKPLLNSESSLRDIVYCPVCGDKLKADYLRYDHIGKIYCPSCGLTNPEKEYSVTNIDREGNTLSILHKGEHHNYSLVNDNIVNIYNICATVASLTEAGLNYDMIANALKKTKIVSSRFEKIVAGDLNITMQLAKGQNPIACARAYSYVVQDSPAEKALLIMVDDKNDNINDSESVCWIYDCDYSPLTHESVKQIVFAGKRCRDHKLRALLTGVNPSVIMISDSLYDGASLINIDKYKNIYICFDPYILKDAENIKKYFTEKGESHNDH